MQSTSRVVEPMHTMRTPVAKGSSVPACPTLADCTSCFTWSTTQRDVCPRGLLIFKRPESTPIGDLQPDTTSENLATIVDATLFYGSSVTMQFERLGPYKIGKRLGRGGMGAVFEGINEETGEAAAVK